MATPRRDAVLFVDSDRALRRAGGGPQSGSSGGPMTGQGWDQKERGGKEERWSTPLWRTSWSWFRRCACPASPRVPSDMRRGARGVPLAGGLLAAILRASACT